MSKEACYESSSFLIHIMPGIVVTREEFMSDKFPANSIALDGFCNGGPFLAVKAGKYNFDHHDGILRLAARATCGQVQVAINLGLLDNFQDKGLIKGHIWVNEIDQDTALAIWLLLNPSHSAGAPLNALVNVEGNLDATAGSYPYYPNLSVMESIFWIFQPYDLLRTEGRLFNLSANEMLTLLQALMANIMQFVIGQGQKVGADMAYELIKSGTGWAMVKEIGRQARYGLYRDGINCYGITLGHNKETGTYRYVIGKRSNLVAPEFDLEKLYDYLNQLEGITQENPDRWGGSDSVGGSPRNSGSKLNPNELFEAIQKFLQGR